MNINQKSISRKEFISVDFLVKHSKDLFRLTLFSDNSGFGRKIIDQNLHRPGLALAGFVDLFSYSRVQIFGNTEMRYLSQLTEDEKKESIERILKFNVPCIILTDGNQPFPVLIQLANKYQTPVFGTPFTTTKLVYLVGDFLDDQFAERISLHGSLVDVYGIGMLFIGKSGVGKSEVALDLIERGHRLVADDHIILTKKGEGILMGSATNLAKHFMEIRGLGIIDVERMFGIRAIRYQKRLEIVVELELWDEKNEYTRTGLDETTINIASIELPHVKLPILPGKNITVISEVIALNYLLRHYGYDAPKLFQERLTAEINKNEKEHDLRQVKYFEHDFE
jgi:HPr kinase/phosphorylase